MWRGQSCVLKLLQRRSEGQRPSWFVRTQGSSSRIIEADLLLKPVAISSITYWLGLLEVSQMILLIACSFSGSRFKSYKFLKLLKNEKLADRCVWKKNNQMEE